MFQLRRAFTRTLSPLPPADAADAPQAAPQVPTGAGRALGDRFDRGKRALQAWAQTAPLLHHVVSPRTLLAPVATERDYAACLSYMLTGPFTHARNRLQRVEFTDHNQ